MAIPEIARKSAGSARLASLGIRSSEPGVPLSAVPCDELTRLYRSTPSVRRVVDYIARAIAVLPWRVYRLDTEDGGRERLADDPAELLLRHPDPKRGVTGYSLVRNLVTDQLVHGRALLVLLDGVPTRVPPELVTVERDALGRLDAVYVHVCDDPDSNEPIKVSDGPFALVEDWDGLVDDGSTGSLRTLMGLLREIEDSARYREVLWRDSVKVTSTFTRDSDTPVSKNGIEAFNERIREFQSARNGLGNLVLDGGWKYSQVTPQPIVQAADLELRNLTDADVATYYGVSPEVLGIRKGTYGSISVFRKMLYGPTLGAHIEALQQALNLTVVPALTKARKTDVVYGEFDTTAMSDGTSSERAAVLQTQVGAPIMTIAEARAELNLPFIEGTEELAIPLNVQQGGGDQASATDSGEQNKDPNRESEPRSNEEDRGTSREVDEPTEPKAGKSADPKVRKSAERLPALADTSALTVPYQEAATLVAAGERDMAVDLLVPHIQAVLAEGNASFERQVPGFYSVPATDNFARSVAEAHVDQLAEVLARTEADLRAAGDDGDLQAHAEADRERSVVLLAALATVDMFRRGERDVLDNAVTETRVWKVWVHNPSSRDPRSKHAAMNGETVECVPGKDTFFRSIRARWPQDTKYLPADEVVNCKCSMNYVTEIDVPDSLVPEWL